MDNLLTYSIKSIICDIKFFHIPVSQYQGSFSLCFGLKSIFQMGACLYLPQFGALPTEGEMAQESKTENEFDASREAIQMKLL